MEVQVSSIIVNLNGSSESVTVGSPFTAVIDSTLPYLYLPNETCDRIATTLGLTQTNTSNGYQLYTINQTQLVNNYQQVQSIQISVTNVGALANPNAVFNGTTIRFPYAAFDLNATWPISPDNVTSYFPIIPAPTDTFILGRTFFQEAYVIADFDREQFSVYQSRFPGPNATETLVPIYNSSIEAELHVELSRGAIAGIVVGCFGFVALVLGLASIWWLWIVKKRRAKGTADGTTCGNSHEPVHSPLSGIAANSSSELEANGSTTRPHHRREISELSSDAENERGNRVNALGSPAIIEMEDKSDATQWQLNSQRISEMPQRPKSPQEME